MVQHTDSFHHCIQFRVYCYSLITSLPHQKFHHYFQASPKYLNSLAHKEREDRLSYTHHVRIRATPRRSHRKRGGYQCSILLVSGPLSCDDTIPIIALLHRRQALQRPRRVAVQTVRRDTLSRIRGQTPLRKSSRNPNERVQRPARCSTRHRLRRHPRPVARPHGALPDRRVGSGHELPLHGRLRRSGILLR